MIKKDIKINVFLVGVQKSATTSLYDWISQHPDVCGPISMKDTPFFIDDTLYEKGNDFLVNVYKKQYKKQKIIINGSAHNIYFDKAIKRISEYNPESKLILILRNPVERAISSYKFALKRNLEKDKLYDAISKEKMRLKSSDIQVLCETTYIDHGLYFMQLKRLEKYFKKNQILVLFYEDVKNKPSDVINKTYQFLDIDSNFIPEFRALNKTGSVRFKFIKNLVYNNSPLKKMFLKYFFDIIIPYDLKYRMKIFILKLITKSDKNDNSIKDNFPDQKERLFLYSYFKKDIENLEKFLKKDLSHWKID